MHRSKHDFSALLRECRVQASYLDVSGRRRRASTDALLALLQSLDVQINDPSQASKVLRSRRHARLLRGLEPIHVAWNGSPPPIEISLPGGNGLHEITVRLDAGERPIESHLQIEALESVGQSNETGVTFLHKRLPLWRNLPFGYHRLRVSAGARVYESLIVSAPRKAFRHQSRDEAASDWGCFLPLHALTTSRDWGIGDFSSLHDLASWAGYLRASDVAVLPMLAAFLDEPFEISPYRPVSRLFWNELYLDVEAVPELAASGEARALVASSDFRNRVDAQRKSELVDYREVMDIKRQVLQILSSRFFAEKPARFAAFQAFVRSQPAVDDYASFRAACERQRTPWPNWPHHMRNGDLSESDYDADAKNYHLYCQWLAVEQLTRLRADATAIGCGLYLDLPIGVDPAGYDAWRHQSQYAAGASAGAPPDAVFTKGQNWGLPPLHPDRSRETGYDLVRRGLATNMKFARHLRIDHILAFHRLYCIPPEFGADQGAYLQYAAEEMYAVASLESHRYNCELIGENLGTVPAHVDRSLKTHAISGMWVAPYELEPGRRAVLSSPSFDQVAMLNTHDMPPLAAWSNGDDIDDRVDLGLIGPEDAKSEREQRLDAIRQLKDWLQSTAEGAVEEDSPDGLSLSMLLNSLAGTPARLFLVNLEDLWFETRSQNVPGVTDERPNWRRKARYRFDEFSQLPDVLRMLRAVDANRKVKDRHHDFSRLNVR